MLLLFLFFLSFSLHLSSRFSFSFSLSFTFSFFSSLFLFFACLLACFNVDCVQRFNLPRSLYTFGSPRLGSVQWTNWFNARFSDSWRFVHYSDLVTSVPPTWTGFAHVGNEVWIPNNGVTPTKTCRRAAADGTEDATCSYSLGFWRKLNVVERIDDHRTYLNLGFSCSNRFMQLTAQQLDAERRDTIRFIAAISGVETTENETTQQIIDKLQAQEMPAF